MHAAWRGVVWRHACTRHGMLRGMACFSYPTKPKPYEFDLFAREPFPLLTFFLMLWLLQKLVILIEKYHGRVREVWSAVPPSSSDVKW